MAKLRIGAGQVTIRRPQSASLTPEPTLTLNFVHVLEPKPPRGEQAVEWALWTTEAVDTAEQILAVVDAYRCRWRIEEYFKALKTGCRIESRQLETYDALVNALAVLAPIAWRLLNLRTAALETPERPASDVLTKTQLVCLAGVLRLKKKPPLPPKPSAREAMLGVAALGGHLRNNGDPGWIVLGRGLEDCQTTGTSDPHTTLKLTPSVPVSSPSRTCPAGPSCASASVGSSRPGSSA
jgi:hypothetical protein